MIVPTIAVDIDDTLNNWQTMCVDYANRYTGRALNFAEMKEYGLSKFFGWNQEERQAFWQRYELESYRRAQVRPGAAEVLRTWRRAGWYIVILTARPWRPPTEAVTRAWLEDNGIVYDELVFDADKAAFCRRRRVAVLVEDAPHNVLPCSEAGVRVFMPCQPYNAAVEHARVVRFTDWRELAPLLLPQAAQVLPGGFATVAEAP